MTPQTILGQTVLLAFRIALVWAGGILFAVAIHAVLPGELGLSFTGSNTTLFLPYNRIGFWTCIWAAVIASILVVIRSMLADFGIHSQI